MTRLSQRQLADLRKVWEELQSEPAADGVPETDDAVCLACLDAWLAGVISSDGGVRAADLDDLLDQQRAAADASVARGYIDRVVATVMPDRDQESGWLSSADTTVQEHCREHGYEVGGGITNRFGYRTWEVAVPGRAGRVDLECNGEVYLLTFPGGFTSAEFAYAAEEEQEALEAQLRLLDAYADPATRTISRRRALRRSRTELHLSDGTVLWRGGGSRAQT